MKDQIHSIHHRDGFVLYGPDHGREVAEGSLLFPSGLFEHIQRVGVIFHGLNETLGELGSNAVDE